MPSWAGHAKMLTAERLRGPRGAPAAAGVPVLGGLSARVVPVEPLRAPDARLLRCQRGTQRAPRAARRGRRRRGLTRPGAGRRRIRFSAAGGDRRRQTRDRDENRQWTDAAHGAILVGRPALSAATPVLDRGYSAGSRLDDTTPMIRKIRSQIFYGLIVATAALIALGSLWHPGWYLALCITVPLVLLGTWDVLQKRHNLLRNYPIVGHLRYLIEDTGAELRQYIVESNTEGKPFNRDKRSLMYQRAKGVSDKKPFGTELDVYAEGYSCLAHSMVPRPVAEDPSENFLI